MAIAAMAASINAQAETVDQSVVLPVYGSPAIPRNLYVASGESTNGLTGYVFALQRTNGSFSLSAAGAPEFVEFDVFFYAELTDMNPTGSFFTCPPNETQCAKTGCIPAGSRYAVVTLALGLAEHFRYVSSASGSCS